MKGQGEDGPLSMEYCKAQTFWRRKWKQDFKCNQESKDMQIHEDEHKYFEIFCEIWNY